MTRDPSSWPPMIVLANWFHFAPGQRVVQGCRQSRLLLWCQQGRGWVRAGGPRIVLSAGRWALLPWATPMEYQADPRRPFVLSAIHWIPCHDPAAPFTVGLSHNHGDALSDLPSRRDMALEGWNREIIEGDTHRAGALIHLAEYIVSHFNDDAPTAQAMITLGRLLVDEVKRTLAPAGSAGGSARVRAAQRFAMLHLAEAIDVSRLAEAAGCSRATLSRLFSGDLHTSPAAWIAQKRVERARELLRTTALPISEVARRVGIQDSYYFSRLFRRQAGLSPRQYRGAVRPL